MQFMMNQGRLSPKQRRLFVLLLLSVSYLTQFTLMSVSVPKLIMSMEQEESAVARQLAEAISGRGNSVISSTSLTDSSLAGTKTTANNSSLSSSDSSLVKPGGTRTIVSAFYEGPSKHTLKKYNIWAEKFLSLDDPMVIFTTPTYAPFVQERRIAENKMHKTMIVTLDLNKTDTVNMFDMEFWEGQHEKDKHKKRHKSYHLYWVWLSKLEFVKRAIEMNPFHSDFFAWVDIGYVRDKKWKGMRMLQHIPETLLEDQVLMLDVHEAGRKPLIGGGFIGGYTKGLLRYNRLFYNHIKDRQSEFIGDDQPMMDEACLVEENVCRLVRAGKWYESHQWFYMLPFLVLGESETEASMYVRTSSQSEVETV